MSGQEFEHLFSYGTLQDEAVQLATFKRRLVGEADWLPQYRRTTLGIHQNVEFTGDESDGVAGTRFIVSSREIAQADIYEDSAGYKRVKVRLNSGNDAWVYAGAPSIDESS